MVFINNIYAFIYFVNKKYVTIYINTITASYNILHQYISQLVVEKDLYFLTICDMLTCEH